MSEIKTTRIKITFDKEELKNRVNKFTYREARRHAGDIYKALEQELLEDGCVISAKYFDRLAAKENDYFKNNVIRERVKDCPDLLMCLYDNCKMAEQKAMLQQSEGMAVTFSLLLQIVCLMDQPQHASKFNWLRQDIYEIVTKICDKLGEGKSNVDKCIAQIYFKYANLLSSETQTMPESFQYYEKAFAMALPNKWLIDTMSPDTGNSLNLLHTLIADHYVSALLNFGKTIATNNYLQAVALGHKAVCVLTRVGRNVRNLHQFVDAQLHMAEFYAKGKDYNMVFSLLANIDGDMVKVDKQHYGKLALRLCLNKGICCSNLGLRSNALTNFKQAVNLSQQLNLKTHEANAHMNIGQWYLQEGGKERILAKAAFVKSMQLYESLGDAKNRQKCKFFLAQATSASVFPLFMDMIKTSESEGNFFKLRRWNDQLKPFWLQEPVEEKQKNDIENLLEEYSNKPENKDLLRILQN
ncbi:uncharacterized protein LOC106089774 [Stomoxys calcitrans]|uniref:Uncharacterized protein n=1 Tax=Stomoxys calcitrans TaxID=35570 RepID=A0A1I8PZC0_STOCA|nr:uncharacterized protein LOC106089774 [Stomoxys calcitrans]